MLVASLCLFIFSISFPVQRQVERKIIETLWCPLLADAKIRHSPQGRLRISVRAHCLDKACKALQNAQGHLDLQSTEHNSPETLHFRIPAIVLGTF